MTLIHAGRGSAITRPDKSYHSLIMVISTPASSPGVGVGAGVGAGGTCHIAPVTRGYSCQCHRLFLHIAVISLSTWWETMIKRKCFHKSHLISHKIAIYIYFLTPVFSTLCDMFSESVHWCEIFLSLWSQFVYAIINGQKGSKSIFWRIQGRFYFFINQCRLQSKD